MCNSWSNYNKKLINSARVDFYINEDVICNWYGNNQVKANRPRRYSDLAIETCLLFKYFFRLGYRQTEGFVRSQFKLLGIEIEVPKVIVN